MKHALLLLALGLAAGFGWRYALSPGERLSARRFARANVWVLAFIAAVLALLVLAFFTRSISIL